MPIKYAKKQCSCVAHVFACCPRVLHNLQCSASSTSKKFHSVRLGPVLLKHRSYKSIRCKTAHLIALGYEAGLTARLRGDGKTDVEQCAWSLQTSCNVRVGGNLAAESHFFQGSRYFPCSLCCLTSDSSGIPQTYLGGFVSLSKLKLPCS